VHASGRAAAVPACEASGGPAGPARAPAASARGEGGRARRAPSRRGAASWPRAAAGCSDRPSQRRVGCEGGPEARLCASGGRVAHERVEAGPGPRPATRIPSSEPVWARPSLRAGSRRAPAACAAVRQRRRAGAVARRGSRALAPRRVARLSSFTPAGAQRMPVWRPAGPHSSHRPRRPTHYPLGASGLRVAPVSVAGGASCARPMSDPGPRRLDSDAAPIPGSIRFLNHAEILCTLRAAARGRRRQKLRNLQSLGPLPSDMCV
jgi:hypothetical protein